MPAQRSLSAPIVDQLRRLHDGDAWHGPSITEALDGVTARQAAMRPVAAGHTIYELTFHLAAWTGEVLQRLQGRPPQLPDEGDFPEPVTAITENEWQAAKARLAERHASLAQALTHFDESRLSDNVGPTPDAPTGTGVTFYAMVHGLIQHDAYHAGQIMIIRKALA